MSDRRQLYYKSTQAWVTSQEICVPAALCSTYRKLNCLESYHLCNLHKGLGESWKFQDLPVSSVDFLSSNDQEEMAQFTGMAGQHHLQAVLVVICRQRKSYFLFFHRRGSEGRIEKHQVTNSKC